jgi:AcrR family transcriptional regulator
MCEARPVTARQDPGPRERLVTAAQRLTYEHGATVGVDALLTEANVARRSLYEHFGGKDGLIAEVLRRSADEDVQRYRAALDAAGDDPRDRLLAVFDELDAIATRPGFRGCRYLGADLAPLGDGHPAHAVTADYRDRVHALLEHELVRLHHPDPGLAADQLHLLIEGTLATGVTRPGVHPGRLARQLAERILD